MNKTQSSAGRPKRSKIESARAAFWASNLSYKSEKSFPDIERELYPESIKKRDGGGFTQPFAFNKYAKGTRSPHHFDDCVDSPVTRAEKKYPGTQSAYSSIFWDLMTIADREIDIKKFYSRISNLSKMQLKLCGVNLENRTQLLLTDNELAIIFRIKNIDVLGLMLLQIKSNKETIRYELIYLIREWLLKASLDYAPFKMCLYIIFEAIEENLIELGEMTGSFGLTVNSTDAEKQRGATMAAIFSGKTDLFKHTYPCN